LLEPHQRRDLIEALKPPAGYTLDFAVGTSYTLDLLSVLLAPLAFTFFSWEGEDETKETPDTVKPTSPVPRFRVDPLALLESVRRYSDKFAVFCQVGQIKVPKGNPLFYSYLENSIFEAAPPRQSLVFHPKVWVLRYVPETITKGAAGPVQYRLLCLSRNLTFDRTWDTMLVLDGTMGEADEEINRPLQDFLMALPGMARREIKAEVRAKIAQLAEGLGKVRFEIPEGFDSIRFWPLGTKKDNSDWPFGGNEKPFDRLAVVSPFLTQGFLTRLSSQSHHSNFLISRLESLDKLAESKIFNHFDNKYVLSYEAQLPDGDKETDEDDDEKSGELAPMVGLHAKLFLAEQGDRARLWTGSANATDAAFNGNIEFLVELGGKRNLVGINCLLTQGENGDAPGLIRLLQPYTPSQTEIPIDLFLNELEQNLNTVCHQLSFLPLRARVVNNLESITIEPGPDLGKASEDFTYAKTKITSGESNTSNSYQLELYIEGDANIKPLEGVKVRAWPITLQELSSSVAVELGKPGDIFITFNSVSLEALTSFFAFEVIAAGKDLSSGEYREIKNRFVLNLPLEGMPENRQELLLKSLLTNSTDVVRYILFLLAQGETPEGKEIIVFGENLINWDQAEGQVRGRKPEPPLFEIMVRSLARNPEKLDQIARLVSDLGSTDSGRLLLPEGFLEIWEPIWQARQRLV
jgi:hypothetical protein